MIFFLAFPFLALALWMLGCAAVTFAIVANIRAFQVSAITAPITACLVAPALALPASLPIYSQIFIIDPPMGSIQFWIRFGTVELLLLVGCFFAAFLANLACRAIFQFIPAWLNRVIQIRPSLLPQLSILAGASFSIAVLLTIAAICVYFERQSLIAILLSSGMALLLSTLCVRAMWRLSAPDIYAPAPLPPWFTTRFLPQRNASPNVISLD